MAKRDIVKDGDPLLRKTSREVTAFDARLGHILDDMVETMVAAEGVGLAAPQIGLLRRFAVCQMTSGEIVELINPKLLEGDGKALLNEGCLSVPGKYMQVPRFAHIKLAYQNRNGESVEREFFDFDARVCQHEMDHLDGILFYDKAVKE